MYLKPEIFILIIALVISSGCEQEDNRIGQERIDGPANVRAEPNGKVLFQLNNDVPVSCTELKGDWYEIGLTLTFKGDQDIPETWFAGSIMEDDHGVYGELLSDMEMSIAYSSKFRFVTITGFTHKDNIQPSTIIENVIADSINNGELSQGSDRYEDIIHQFDLHETKFGDFDCYCCYDSWVDDPSPMYRVCLCFEENELKTIIHKRTIKSEFGMSRQLDRGFNLLLLDANLNVDSIANEVNYYLNQVD